jgi:hypothetical protein
MNRPEFPARVWLSLMVVTGLIAIWDIWTRGSLVVAVVMTAATVAFGFAGFNQRTRSRINRREQGP